MLNKLDAAFNFHQTALRIRNQRQEMLASNIANADTPQYKARDIDFAYSLTQALQANSGKQTVATGQLQRTQAQHLSTSGASALADSDGAQALFRPIIQGSVDGNTVDLDVERNAFVDNGLRYEASLTMINGQIKKMLTAITGQ